MNNQSLRFFIYIRKSTDETDKQVRSLDDQRSELRTLAATDGLNVVGEYQEALTAKTPGRPVFNQVLDRIEAGEADAILAWHPDRLARNAVDGGRVIQMVDSGALKNLRFPTWWFEPTPQGLFALSMAFGQSKYYVDSLSENIKRAYRQKVAQGIWPVHPPYGYMYDRRGKAIVPDPDIAPAIRQTFELYARGDMTFAALRDRLTVAGVCGRSGQPLSLSQLQHLLRHPVYHGMIVFKGELYEGKHEPIVSKELFDRVQAVMNDRSRPRPLRRRYNHPCRGVFRCGECGCAITTEDHKGHTYLRCTKKKGPCSQPYLRQEILERQVAERIHALSISDELADTWLASLDLEETETRAGQSRGVDDLDRQIAGIDAKLERLLELRLDDAVALEEYLHRKNRLMAERADLKAKRRNLADNPASSLEPARHFIRACNRARYLAPSENLAAKCRFLSTIGSNLTIRDRKLRLRPIGAWKYIETEARQAESSLGVTVRGKANREGFTTRSMLPGAIRPVLETTPRVSVSPSDIVGVGRTDDPSTHPSIRLEGQAALAALS